MRALIAVLVALAIVAGASPINRKAVVQRFNPSRNASSNTTPLQLGNGNFAFGADITGLQTFQPFNTLSSWGWHNTSLPTALNQNSPDEFIGQDWWTHGRLVNYDQPNTAQPLLSQWLIANPHRINLARIGLVFGSQNVTEEQLQGKHQTLDLYEGKLESMFVVDGKAVTVRTWVHPEKDVVAVEVDSQLQLGVFVDFPYANGVSKFEAPFVGIWDAVANHSTTMAPGKNGAQIKHTLDATTYFTTFSWAGQKATVTGPLPSTHRYQIHPTNTKFSFTASFSPEHNLPAPIDVAAVKSASAAWWKAYWESGAFLDVTATPGDDTTELQRRVVLSQYLMAVNEAGHDPPQESGLTNNGWYGKFHLEMPVWHLLHWAPWGKWQLLDRSLGVYQRFLPSSLERAAAQGYTGARWGKMSDPSGRSAPGEINSLLIWQQPHPMLFAENEWRSFPTKETLDKWSEVLHQTAEFMASYAWWNVSTGVYDLGPPMYPASENTEPNSTVNPTFELAYWRFGLGIASEWKKRLGKEVPASWTHVLKNLAPLPVSNGTYELYEGIPNMWTDPNTVSDHPALIGTYGLLPPVPGLNVRILSATAQRVWETWNLSDSYGWDFPMLAMNAARLGDSQKAVEFLLHVDFAFDDAGMPEGGVRVATPYFPASGALLLAVGMLAGGWDGAEGPHFPTGWTVNAEGFAVWM